MENIENACGIELYWTKNNGIDGQIKKKPEDFVVEEIPLKKEPGKTHTYALVEKKGLTTLEVVKILSNELGITRKKIGYAGNKDKNAVTKQWFSIQGVEPKDLVELDIENIRLSDFTKADEPIKLGDLERNKFLITLRNIEFSVKNTSQKLNDFSEEIKSRGIPNFFGPQRFGSKRAVSHLIGREMIKGNLKKAVKTYLTHTSDQENQETKKAREKLKPEKNYSEALEYFPKYLRYERKILKTLKNQENYLKAFKSFPFNLRKLFIHAYQSWIFNKTLSKVLEPLKDKKKISNFPIKLVGYKTKLDEERKTDRIISEILDSEGIKLEDFKIRHFKPGEFKNFEAKRLSAPGSVRSALMGNINFKTKVVKKDEIYPDKTQATLYFELKSGRYATTVLREVRK